MQENCKGHPREDVWLWFFLCTCACVWPVMSLVLFRLHAPHTTKGRQREKALQDPQFWYLGFMQDPWPWAPPLYLLTNHWRASSLESPECMPPWMTWSWAETESFCWKWQLLPKVDRPRMDQDLERLWSLSPRSMTHAGWHKPSTSLVGWAQWVMTWPALGAESSQEFSLRAQFRVDASQNIVPFLPFFTASRVEVNTWRGIRASPGVVLQRSKIKVQLVP